MGRPTQGYRDSDGEKIPGTTTIIGRYKESGGLLQWAYKQGREHEDLSHRGEDAPKHLYDIRDKAAEAGTVAHDMIEADILGTEYEVPEDISEELVAQAKNAYSQYKEWRDNSKLEIIKTEESYVSERFKFGGTVDAIGKDSKGRIVLVDWKTSNKVYSDMMIQLAAYDILIEECAPEYKQTGGYHLLRIAKDSADFAHHYYGELKDAKKAFLLMRQLYDLDKKLKQRTK